jgi:oligopeptide/dipeptide ABC transporter ATP-binding protein
VLFRSVNGLSFDIEEGEIIALVGESGSGKSVASLSVIRLVPKPGKVTGGSINFAGTELLRQSDRYMRDIRGKKISMIFQEPMTSLNPVFTIGEQISEIGCVCHKLNKKEAREKALDYLNLVGIPSPEQRYHEYPHQISGGMRQRVMIAMALMGNPRLLIADEPTTALDVTIQAQILDLILQLKDRLNMAVLLITHDLGIVAEIARRVIIMYTGKKVEEGPVESVFENPLHPYTRGLLKAIPSLSYNEKKLYVIPGLVPNNLTLSEGCSFAPRCGYKQEICTKMQPGLKSKGDRKIACWHDF